MTPLNQIVDIAQYKPECESCGLHRVCLPYNLEREDMRRLSALVRRRRPLERGDYVFRSGDEFHSLHVVRSGVVKTYLIDEQGDEHITGFHFPGSVLGLDAMGQGRYTRFARALDTTGLCDIPFRAFDELMSKTPALRRQFVSMISELFLKEQQVMVDLAQMPAEQRLANFFLRRYRELTEHGFSGTSFPLKISNVDLGTYLGLAGETISRVLARFRSQGTLSISKRHVNIMSLERLVAASRTESAHVSPRARVQGSV